MILSTVLLDHKGSDSPAPLVIYRNTIFLEDRADADKIREMLAYYGFSPVLGGW